MRDYLNGPQHNAVHLSGEIPTGDYQVDSITYVSNGMIDSGKVVLLQAGTKIVIDSTVTIDFGVDFNAEIIDCQ